MADQEPEETAGDPSKKEAAPTPESAGAPAPDPEQPAEEVAAEPFDAASDKGPTVDMPPPGSKAKGAAASSAAMAAACHLLGLADLTFSEFLIGFLAPLILWLVFKDKDPEVDYHGKESINFQLNVLFWSLVSWVLVICIIGIPLRFALSIIEIVLIILASIAAANGERYRYPFIYRILQ